MNKQKSNRFKFKTIAFSLLALGIGITQNANAALHIDSSEPYYVQVNEGKFADISDAQAKDELRWAKLVNLLENMGFGSQPFHENLADLSKDVLRNGDKFKLYKRGGSQEDRISAEQIVRVGAGSNFISINDVPSMNFNGKTYNLAGGVTSGLVSVGNNQETRTISGVSAGNVSEKSTDAVNGSQLHAVMGMLGDVNNQVTNNANNIKKGVVITGDTGNHTFQLGEPININGGKNIVTKVNDDRLEIALKDDVSVNSITVNGGVEINNNGINAGNKKITNVADGDVSDNSTDAVNGSQLHKTNLKVESNSNEIEKGLNFKADKGDVFNAKLGDTVTIKGDGKNIATESDGKGGTKVVLNNNVTADSFTSGNVSISTAGVNAGDKKVANVAKGEVSENSTDAINGSQLHVTNTKVDGNTANINKLTEKVEKGLYFDTDEGNSFNVQLGEKVTINGDEKNIKTKSDTKGKLTVELANNIKVDSVTTGDVSISNDGVNAGNKKVINVIDGDISDSSSDAVNGSQLHKTNVKVEANSNEIEKGLNFKADKGDVFNAKLGDTVAIKGDGKNIATESDGKGGTKVILNNNVTADSFTSGNVSISNNGIDAGSKKITNVADGEISDSSKDAINGSQISKLIKNINNNGGVSQFDIETEKGKKTVDLNEGYKFKGDGNTHTSVNDKSEVIVGLNPEISLDKVTTGDVSISKNGVDAGNKKVINVTKGDVSENSTDAINGSQLHVTNTKVDGNTINITKNANNIAKGFNVASDNGSVHYKLGDTVSIKGGKNIITSTKDESTFVGLNDDINLNTINANVVRTGDISISSGGVNAGGKVITNVADGKDDTDAVNVRQLKNAVNNIGTNDNRINEVDQDAKNGIASVAAMDIEYPETKAGQFAAGLGVGHYRGTTAVGVGATFLTENGRIKFNAAYGQALQKKSSGVGKASIGMVF